MANILLFDSLFNLTLDIFYYFLASSVRHAACNACMHAHSAQYTVRFVRSCNKHPEQFTFQNWWNSNRAKHYNTNNNLCIVCKQKLFVYCTVHIAQTYSTALILFSTIFPVCCSFSNTVLLNFTAFHSHCSQVWCNSVYSMYYYLHIFGIMVYPPSQ